MNTEMNILMIYFPQTLQKYFSQIEHCADKDCKVNQVFILYTAGGRWYSILARIYFKFVRSHASGQILTKYSV